jgi:hypothetical protein
MVAADAKKRLIRAGRNALSITTEAEYRYNMQKECDGLVAALRGSTRPVFR